MLRLALVAGLAGLLATAAVAQTHLQATEPSSRTPPDISPSPADATDPDKVVCKTVRPPTGTRVSSGRTRSKMCMTKADWDEQARQAQEMLKLRDSGMCPNEKCSG